MNLPGIPFFVTAYGAVLFSAGSLLGLGAFINPSSAIGYVEGAVQISGGWAGRTFGMALVQGLSLYLKTPEAYALGFLNAFCRELGDVFGAVAAGETGAIPMLGAFLLLDTICLGFSIKSLMDSSKTSSIKKD